MAPTQSPATVGRVDGPGGSGKPPPPVDEERWKGARRNPIPEPVMNRILIAAAPLAALFAAGMAMPAGAQTIRISTAGKSTEQVQTEIRAAARSVCAQAYANIPTPLGIQSACTQDVERNARAQLRDQSYAMLSPPTRR